MINLEHYIVKMVAQQGGNMVAKCVFTALKKGTKAVEQTKLLQTALHDQGFYNYAIDGQFLEKTDEGLRAYQKQRGLKIDGIAYKITCTSLGIWCNQIVKSNKVCSITTPIQMQINNWTCGVFCILMALKRHGITGDYDRIVKYAGSNPTNGTGHSGIKAVLKDLYGYKYAESFYRKSVTIDHLKELIKEGYDIFINLDTGGLNGWGGNWHHWVLLQCLDDLNYYINDPDRGPAILQQIIKMNASMDRNGNLDYILAKK